jgi:hypothetical protein
VEQPDIQLDANRLVTFDGRVLEVFGGAVRRFHVALLAVTVSDPDKKGNRNVTLTQAGNDWSCRSTDPPSSDWRHCCKGSRKPA